MRPYDAWEVVGSERARAETEARPPRALGGPLVFRHFVLALHDGAVEVIAEGYELLQGRFATLREAAARCVELSRGLDG